MSCSPRGGGSPTRSRAPRRAAACIPRRTLRLGGRFLFRPVGGASASTRRFRAGASRRRSTAAGCSWRRRGTRRGDDSPRLHHCSALRRLSWRIAISASMPQRAADYQPHASQVRAVHHHVPQRLSTNPSRRPRLRPTRLDCSRRPIAASSEPPPRLFIAHRATPPRPRALVHRARTRPSPRRSSTPRRRPRAPALRARRSAERLRRARPLRRPRRAAREPPPGASASLPATATTIAGVGWSSARSRGARDTRPSAPPLRASTTPVPARQPSAWWARRCVSTTRRRGTRSPVRGGCSSSARPRRRRRERSWCGWSRAHPTHYDHGARSVLVAVCVLLVADVVFVIAALDHDPIVSELADGSARFIASSTLSRLR